MTQSLDSYSAELTALESLFGEKKVAQNFQRLKYIHEHTEALWHNHVSQMPDRRVNYSAHRGSTKRNAAQRATPARHQLRPVKTHRLVKYGE